MQFLLIKSPHVPTVLGHNPLIDWATGSIMGWSPFCHAHCLMSASLPWDVFLRAWETTWISPPFLRSTAALWTWLEANDIRLSWYGRHQGLPGFLRGEVGAMDERVLWGTDLLSVLCSHSRSSIHMVKAMRESRSIGSSQAASSSLTSYDNPRRNMLNRDSGFQALSLAIVQKSTE
jgi:hypothetical protein